MTPALILAGAGGAVGATLLIALSIPATPPVDDLQPAPTVRVPAIRDPASALQMAARSIAGADDPGARFAAEEAAFLASVSDAPPAAVPAVVAPAPLPAPPPPPDLSYAIGAAVAAIDRSTGRPELILAEGGGSRRLAAGGEYRDGWRLAGVDGQTILLSRGRESRRVAIRYGPPQPPPASRPVMLATPEPSGPQLPPGVVPPDPDLARVAAQGVPAPPRRLLRRPGKT